MHAVDADPDAAPPCGAPRTLPANGLALHAYQWGRPGAPPVLLLHSLAAHAHWWDWVAPRLARERHVIALDARGHGGSAWAGPGAYGFDDHVADVVAVLDALTWRAPLVLGHSLGAYVGALLAARHAERVAALVVTDMLTSWSGDLDRFARRQVERPAAEFPTRAAAAERFRLAPPDTSAPAARVRHLGEAGAVERHPGVWTQTFDRHVFGHPPPDPWPFLPAVACPTLVVRGEGSTVMDAAACQRVAATVRRGEAVELAGTYHHLIVEDPDGYAALVERWQAGLGPPAARP